MNVGAANVLCLILSMSEREDKIRGTCVALERGRRVIGMRRISELRLPLAGHPVMGERGAAGIGVDLNKNTNTTIFRNQAVINRDSRQ